MELNCREISPDKTTSSISKTRLGVFFSQIIIGYGFLFLDWKRFEAIQTFQSIILMYHHYKLYFVIVISFICSACSVFAKVSYVQLVANKSFASQCKQENTIYDIREDFNLNGATVRIPKGSVLKLNGGTINNGRLVLQSNTKIVGTGEIFYRLLITIDDKNVENILIDGIELSGYKNIAKKGEDIVTGIRVNLGATVNNLTISNCIIHNFNAGITTRGSNIYIRDNVLYDNGHKQSVAHVHDGEVDICAGYNSTNIHSCNFIITGNRCLSKYVHRNIDCAEIMSEDNILISSNICVSMDGMTEDAAEDIYKSQCILVGYAGTSVKDRGVIISNNICKHCHWSAIYVRADNQEKTAGTNGYVALITGNYIENIKKHESNTFSAAGSAIACELREGSMISNNIIKNCTQGINLGYVFSYGHVKVFGNAIDNCQYGVLNYSVARKIDITENSITNISFKGISIFETTALSDNANEKYINISNNIITLKGDNAFISNGFADGNPTGVFLYNIGATSFSVSSNFVHGDNESTNVGIFILQNAKDSFVSISDNMISGCRYGISKKADSELRNLRCRMRNNDFRNCVQAFVIGANSNKQLFIVENNSYYACGSKFGDQSWARMVFDGSIKPDGSFVIYDDCPTNLVSNRYGKVDSAPVCFFDKQFKEGDVVVPSKKEYFSSATCLRVDKGKGPLWRFTDASMPDDLVVSSAMPGQMVFSTTSYKMKYYDRTWSIFE